MKSSYLAVTAALSVAAGFLGGFAGGALVTPTAATAQQSSKLMRVVTAEEFRVVDAKGRVVASLGTEPSLLSRLNLYDRDGGLRASLSLSAIHETVGLSLYSRRRDVHSLRVATQPDGTSGLTLFDESGSPSASLGNLYEEAGRETVLPRPALKFFGVGSRDTVTWRAP